MFRKPSDPSLTQQLCEFLTPSLMEVSQYLSIFNESDKLPVLIIIDKFAEENFNFVIEPIYQNEDEKEVLLQDGLMFKIVSISMQVDHKGEYV